MRKKVEKMYNKIKTFKEHFEKQILLVITVYRNYNDSQTQLWTASLTYYSILAVIPVIALTLGITKGFGIDMVFNGVSGLTKQLNVANVHQPLRNGNTNIATWYLKDKIRWTEAMKDVANVPRLSTLSNENNYQTSTQWIEDGSFLKLRNLNVYYNLPQKWVKKIKLDKLQIYAKAQNVFSIDKIDYFNCEDLTLGYPDLFSVCLGLNINF